MVVLAMHAIARERLLNGPDFAEERRVHRHVHVRAAASDVAGSLDLRDRENSIEKGAPPRVSAGRRKAGMLGTMLDDQVAQITFWRGVGGFAIAVALPVFINHPERPVDFDDIR